MSLPTPIICLMGPTACGKTDLAVELVQRHPEFQIISVDSALVYQGLDIGTAKPSPAVQSIAPHRLIDICDPALPYSAGDFQNDALREITQIQQQQKIPLLVGGTMLYFWVLEHGLATLPTADATIRAEISHKAATQGWPALHAELQQVDPQAATRIHPHDGQRIQRALEVYRLTGRPISANWQSQPNQRRLNLQHFILTASKAVLTERIRARFKYQIDHGFIEEVESLRRRPDIYADLPAMRTVGYRQVWEHLDGQYDFTELCERAYFATCQLAKRQLTWLRRWQQANWYCADPGNSGIKEIAHKIAITALKI